MDNRSSQKPQKAFQKANRFCSTFLSWHPSKSGIGIGKKKLSLGQKFKLAVCSSSSCFTKHNPYLTPKSIPQFSMEVYIFIFLTGRFFRMYLILWIVSWNSFEKHVSNKTFWKKMGTLRRCCHQKLCHISLDWQHLWWIHRLYKTSTIQGKPPIFITDIL